jgi:hypothetical protein
MVDPAEVVHTSLRQTLQAQPDSFAAEKMGKKTKSARKRALS